ncbi:lipocalin-like domain-containing protein [Bacteroidota bacterium]
MKIRKITFSYCLLLFLFATQLFSLASDKDKVLVKNSDKITNTTILFQENFEDTDFASRGWYDALRGTITTEEHIEGSASCLECRFLQGERGCEGGTPGRHLFEETDEIYLSYYVKYSANYTGSDKPYHPHEFHFITNENSVYVGPAYTHLTLYIEHNEGEPLLAIQDAENIDESNIGVDLSDITEERAVAGCNGDSDGYGEGDCYLSGNLHRNGKQWRTGDIYFQDTPGKYYKNDWHFIEAYFKLNSIAEGKGIPDGVVRYWFDGEVLIDNDDVMLRTGQHPDMKFNQFLMAPYIGDGSPVEQVMWIDDLTVATSRVNTETQDSVPDWKSYPYTEDGSILNFPEDEGWHPNEDTEWWYTCAHVTGDSTGTEYSFMLTYFYHPQFGFNGFRIFNIADDTEGFFYTDTKPCNYDILAQDYLNIQASVFGGANEEWVTLEDESSELIPFQYHLAASSQNGSIDVNYNTLKRPLMVGGTGFMYQGKAGYTYYYSQTMLEVSGDITINGVSESINGTAWIDRQYGQFDPSQGEAYEWFCVQLSNGMDLNFWNVFTEQSQIPDTSTYRMCSIYINDSTNLFTSDFELKRQKYSFMPDSAMCYAQKWNFLYEDIDLTITTEYNDNEDPSPFRFYEGSTFIEGTVDGEPVTGVGFAELLHSYENPEINIISPKGYVEWNEAKPVIWQINNPDEGRPLYYDIEIKPNDTVTHILRAQRLEDTIYYWNTTGYGLGTELSIKITAYSIDSVLIGIDETENPLIIIATGVDDYRKEYLGLSVIPNPFSEASTLSFNLPNAVIVNLIITNLLGSEVVRVINNEFSETGQHSIDYDATNLPAGVYFCTIRAGAYTETVKMVVIR